MKSQQLFLGYYKELSELKSTISHNARELIAAQKEELLLQKQHILQSSRSMLAKEKQNLLLSAQKTLQRPQSIIQQKKSDLEYLKGNLKIFTGQYLRSRRLQLEEPPENHKTAVPAECA
ncbi:hypothetical protein [Flavobacterium sp. MMS24-S5]|uniref:hypothetical protein n=1 Tax=Flavobacterium sp. MMS24-S5 TaxID=3416605 RepID=UPI003D07432D